MEWDSLALCVPTLIRNEIKKKYSNDTQCKRAMLKEWRNHHPAPSWMLVADALYSGFIGDVYGKYHNVLQVVREKYLKGEIFLHLSHCVVAWSIYTTLVLNIHSEWRVGLDFRFENTPTPYPSSRVHCHC